MLKADLEIAERDAKAFNAEFAGKVATLDGPTMAHAIREFEARFPAVPDDGILGPLTWSELVVPLQPGARGDAVKAVQTLLNDNGAALGVDGIFGPQTRDAVVTVERTNGLHVDGIVDDDVWKLLLARSAAGTS